MNVCEEKTHISSPTWNFCIHFKSADSTSSKKPHFTYVGEISVFINFIFTYVRHFFAIFRTYTRRGLKVTVGYVTFDDLAEVILSSTSSCFKGITNCYYP